MVSRIVARLPFLQPILVGGEPNASDPDVGKAGLAMLFSTEIIIPIVPSSHRFPFPDRLDRSILAAQAAGMEWTAIPKDPERKEWDPGILKESVSMEVPWKCW